MKLTAEKDITIHADPLSITSTFDVVGGPTTQIYYANSDEYVPDRSLTPLTIKPIVYGTDPSRGFIKKDLSSLLANTKWFIRENGTDKPLNGIDGFKKEGNNLKVSKNTQQESPLMLVFTSEIYDNIRGEIVKIASIITLDAVNNRGSDAIPELRFDKDENWKVDPLDFKGTVLPIKAIILSSDSDILSKIESIRWIVNDKDVSEDDLYYISGQGEVELKLDFDYLPDCILKCVVNIKGYGKPFQNTVKYTRAYSKSLYADIDVVSGARVSKDTEKIKLRAEFKTSKGLVENPDKYFWVDWVIENVEDKTKTKKLGHGINVEAYKEDIINDGMDKLRPKLSAIALGYYSSMTNADGVSLTDSNGNLITTR